MVDDSLSGKRTNREISNANLIRIKPGETLNPGGRPKDTVSALLKEKDRQAVADKLYQLALKGDMRAIQEYMDRTEGKVTDTHKIEGEVPVTIIYNPVEKKVE